MEPFLAPPPFHNISRDAEFRSRHAAAVIADTISEKSAPVFARLFPENVNVDRLSSIFDSALKSVSPNVEVTSVFTCANLMAIKVGDPKTHSFVYEFDEAEWLCMYKMSRHSKGTNHYFNMDFILSNDGFMYVDPGVVGLDVKAYAVRHRKCARFDLLNVKPVPLFLKGIVDYAKAWFGVKKHYASVFWSTEEQRVDIEFYHDAGNDTQVWLTVKFEPGLPQRPFNPAWYEEME